MIPLADPAEVVAADQAAQDAGTPVAVLMGRAGDALAGEARQLLGRVTGRRVVALVGRGHNGGDALETLARLARRGAGVTALTTADPDRLDHESRRAAAAVQAAGGRILPFTDTAADRLLPAADLVVDGLLGTGASGAPRGLAAAAVAATARTRAPVLAVDIPSGVDGLTGATPGPAVTATVTVTFQAARPGHLLGPGADHTGRLAVADIGLPLVTTRGILTPADLVPLVPVPASDAHKWSRGALLTVAGGPGMAGAAVLTCLGARGGGAGLLLLAAPADVTGQLAGPVPEALTLALPGAETDPEALVDRCRPWLGRVRALAVGPGLGRAPATLAAVRALLTAADVPAVVDADALAAIDPDMLAARRAPTLLTPHEGEFARLRPAARGTRLDRAAAAARDLGTTVLLKGARTVVAAPDGRLAVNPTGVPQLASAGTGDVLTGLAGALLAQGRDPFDAACLAAWVHGDAARRAAGDLGPVAVAAGDVAARLPAALTGLIRTHPPASWPAAALPAVQHPFDPPPEDLR